MLHLLRINCAPKLSKGKRREEIELKLKLVGQKTTYRLKLKLKIEVKDQCKTNVTVLATREKGEHYSPQVREACCMQASQISRCLQGCS